MPDDKVIETGRDWLDPETGYSFLAEAAVAAREESRRYWASKAPPTDNGVQDAAKRLLRDA